MGQDFVGGRLKNYLPFWNTLTSDNYILQIVSGAKLEFDCPVKQYKPCRPIRCSLEQKQMIDSEIDKYLITGIIEKTNHSQGEFVSQIFPVPKKSGGLRIILNLKPLNMDVTYKHFKMENLNSVLNLIERDCFMASIDLQDAYYSVNIHKQYRKFLKFIWNDQLYQFTCLPNGLSSAPRWFTKLLKPVFSNLRSQGYVSIYYLDDTWLMGKTENECYSNVVSTLKILTDAGFLINVKKSVVTPSQTITFLGFILDSVAMTISLPLDKRERIISMCTSLNEGDTTSIRYLAKVIGVLVSSLPAVPYGALHYRYLEHDKIMALRISHGKFDEFTSLSYNARTELQWWIANAHSCIKTLNIQPYTNIITTDASLLGWGAVYQSKKTGGQWTPEESKLHINVLELMAIFFGLKSFLTNVENSHIRIQSDSTTAVHYINNLGGVKSMTCHKVAKDIWLWALSNDNHLSAEHLPGSKNLVADSASRIFDDNTEWTLYSNVFVNIEKQFGPLSIDLFASRLNAKHSNYVSWKPDPYAQFIDAFSRSWNNYNNFYAFPPFSIIMQCLQKVITDKAKGIIIVPLWPTQVWFPKLMQMLISPPIVLPRGVLHLPFKKTAVHQLQDKLHLVACQISGNTLEVEEFQNNQLHSCANPGAILPLNSMKHIIKSGYLSVLKGRMIPCNIMKL